MLFSGCSGGGSRGSSDSDKDGDGVLNSADVDDDNNGLIEISSLEQLDAMRNNLKGTSLNGDDTGCPQSGCNGYELITNLDFDTNSNGNFDSTDLYFNNGYGWEPIGKNSDVGAFSANFDGNGHVISHLTIKRGNTAHVGLFGDIFGNGDPNMSIVIQNVVLENVSITGDTVVGALVGQVKDVYSKVTINNCNVSGTVTGKVTTFSPDIFDGIGGLVGISEGSGTNITHSDANVSVSSTGNGAGGLVGLNYNGASITSSHAMGDVSYSEDTTKTGGSGSAFGGLVGYNYGKGASISGSYATGSVTTTSFAAGGLVGSVNFNVVTTEINTDVSTISKSFATGAVQGQSSVGGLVGIAHYATIQNTFATGSVSAGGNAGGLVGFAVNIDEIAYSYAVNNVTDGNNVGGFVGYSDTVTYTGNYFANDTIPQRTDCIGYIFTGSTPGVNKCSGQTTTEMQCPHSPGDTINCATSVYSGWAAGVWNFGDSSQLPALVIDGMVQRP